jgi:hypothetical protein
MLHNMLKHGEAKLKESGESAGDIDLKEGLGKDNR